MLEYLRKILLCSLCLLGLSVSSMYATHVFGNAKEYANSEIIFYRYQDRITYIKEEVFRLRVDAEGNFVADFGIDRITYIFAEKKELQMKRKIYQKKFLLYQKQ